MAGLGRARRDGSVARGGCPSSALWPLELPASPAPASICRPSLHMHPPSRFFSCFRCRSSRCCGVIDGSSTRSNSCEECTSSGARAVVYCTPVKQIMRNAHTSHQCPLHPWPQVTFPPRPMLGPAPTELSPPGRQHLPSLKSPVPPVPPKPAGPVPAPGYASG